jgi:uncharacterized membrane protein
MTVRRPGLALKRLVGSAAIGLLGAAVAAAFSPWQATVLVGWDTAMVVFGIWVWTAVLPMDPAEAEQHALQEDSSIALADLVIVGASLASLGAVALVLVRASSSHGAMRALLIIVGIVSVVLSWGAVHTTFMLRYGRLYYGAPRGGIDFNEDALPDYADFAYLAFTIGMTFQVSDTDLETKLIRRTALRQALLSYMFGAVIIGLVINVVASLLH